MASSSLVDYLVSLGIDVNSLNNDMCNLLPSKFFNNVNVVRERLKIPMATNESKYMVLQLPSVKYIKGIKELKYEPLTSCNDILIDMNDDVEVL